MRLWIKQWGQGDLNPHRLYSPNDFKSRASTNSAMPPAVRALSVLYAAS